MSKNELHENDAADRDVGSRFLAKTKVVAVAEIPEKGGRYG
jgi:hypothetical protein